MSPTEMKRRLSRLNLQQATEQAVDETASEYVRLNTSQMYAGLNAYGQEITPGYSSETYADEKHAMNPSAGYGTPDMKYSGAFYAGYEVSLQGDKLVSDSNVEYAGRLFTDYDIAGLDPDNLKIYRDGVFRDAMKTAVEGQMYG